MLSFFRKNGANVKKEGKDSTISSNEILNESEEQVNDEATVETELSLHPTWTMSTEQNYVYRFLNNELEPLKPNQISLSGIELHEDGDNLVAIAFVRNSVNKPITFNNTTLLLLDQDKQLIARHEFNLEELGELPANSSRPWQFLFPKETIVKRDFLKSDWTLAFEIKPKHSLDLEESWNSSLSAEGKEQLQRIVDGLTPPKEGEVNFMGLQASKKENGDLHITVLIRNGSLNTINIQQLPLQVFDAQDELVAKGGFQLNDLEVKGNTTKPWTFIFPASLVIKAEPDLSRWKVAAIEG